MSAEIRQFAATVTPEGFGSSVQVDGIELPCVKSFYVEAHIDGASLTVEILPEGIVSGKLRQLQIASSIFVVTSVDKMPVKAFGSEESAMRYISEGALVASVTEVPLEIVL